MPIHDWTRVRANRFHDFHQTWTVAICNNLNAGRLPPGYFAMVEQKAGSPEADDITLETRTEAAGYARKANLQRPRRHENPNAVVRPERMNASRML